MGSVTLMEAGTPAVWNGRTVGSDAMSKPRVPVPWDAGLSNTSDDAARAVERKPKGIEIAPAAMAASTETSPRSTKDRAVIGGARTIARADWRSDQEGE